MNTANDILRKRAEEIEKYYKFIDSYINTNSSRNNDPELNKILKANLFLMLYNLIESSISNAIEAIHNNIHCNNIDFDSLRLELKTTIIKQLKEISINTKVFLEGIDALSTDIVKKCFNKRKVSNGNIDSKSIKTLGRNYGFEIRTIYTETRDGSSLDEIKEKRNDLAHGTFSFSEIGQNYSIEDLEKMKNETIHYLRQVLNNIDTYLTNQHYKSDNQIDQVEVDE